MKHLAVLTLFASTFFHGCQHPQASTLMAIPDPAQAPKSNANQNGLPQFTSVQNAIAFALEEGNIEKFTGVVFGSEHFKIPLPSGGETDNWLLSCYFRALFEPFGKSAYRELAPLLNHHHEFVRWGSYFALKSYMNQHGLKRHDRDTDLEISRTTDQLRSILERQGL